VGGPKSTVLTVKRNLAPFLAGLSTQSTCPSQTDRRQVAGWGFTTAVPAPQSPFNSCT